MAKKISQPKLISSKKIPKLYRKKYTSKKLEKKIYKKLYIDKDREFVESFFKKNESGFYTGFFPEKMIKTDVLRLKKLAKQIKKQKGRIKILPLIAVLVTIAIVMITVLLGKNIFVKTILQKNLESVFEAKTTIEQVNVELFNSRISLENLSIANKDFPMKNLFEVGKIELDFNLAQLLRGRFVSENIEATGMQFGTNRKISGALSSIKNTSNSEISNEKNEVAISNQKDSDSVKMQISDFFDNYDPKTIIEESTNELQTPNVAKKSEQQIKEIVSKWQEESNTIQTKVTVFNTSANKLIKKDYSSIKDPLKIKSALIDINDSLRQAKDLKNEIDTITKDISTDRDTVNTMEKTLQSVINNDKDIINDKINTIKSLSVKDSEIYVVNNVLESVGLGTLIKYLPYINKAINIAKTLKKAKEENSIKKATKDESRLSGRDIYYKRNSFPTFLIEKIQCSGPEFSAKITDISNDANLWGKPIFGDADFTHAGISHKILVTVDARTTTDASLINVMYTGSGYKISIGPEDIPYTAVGIPSINGTNTVSINANADTDGSFNGSGLLKVADLNISTDTFDPEWGYLIYKNALQNINTMNVTANFAFKPDSGLTLNIKNDADSQIQKIVINDINSVIDEVKITAKNQALEELKKYTNSFDNQLKDFNNLDLLLRQINIDSTITSLNDKKDGLTKQTTEKAQEVIEDKTKDLIKGFKF
ncbi:MAG: hypothetical protein BKP49_01905 [Treponema sp. CETP13]|nr:MAG: hypothetical protein BKP49_01905 [Treponema sp. CETP13]